MNSPAEAEPGVAGPALRRTVGPWQLAFYGLGSMLGSGIYALIGQAAGLVGNAIWLSFMVALVAALLTALSYASLGSRHPRACWSCARAGNRPATRMTPQHATASRSRVRSRARSRIVRP